MIGRGADPSLLRRLSLDHAIALAAVTAEDLQNIRVALTARAEARGLRIVLRAGSNATGGETRSLERLGHVRDVHRIGAVYIAGIALGSAAAHVVVDGDTAHLRDADGGLERCPYPRRAADSCRPSGRPGEPDLRRVDRDERAVAAGLARVRHAVAARPVHDEVDRLRVVLQRDLVARPAVGSTRGAAHGVFHASRCPRAIASPQRCRPQSP